MSSKNNAAARFVSKLWDLVIISKLEEGETGKVEVVRDRMREYTAESVVDDIRQLIAADHKHDSDIFFNGLKISALDRNAFYRAAQGDLEAYDYIRTLNDIPKRFTGRPGDKLEMTREEFAELFPVDCDPLVSS